MTNIDTVFESSSREIFSLIKNSNDVNFQKNLLDSSMFKNHSRKLKKRKENARFKTHPELLTSTDSEDESEDTFENRYNNYRVIRHHFSEEICDNSKQKRVHVTSSKQDSLSSSVVELNCRNDTCGNVNIKFDNEVKDSIENKQDVNRIYLTEVQRKQAEKKLLNFLQKTVSCLEAIRISLNTKVAIPDGDQDWERRRVQNMEFASRLQRNYLYQLGRQIAELQKFTKSSVERANKSLNKCLLNAHQTLLQAFQAYHKHIPISLGNTIVDKLKIVIQHTNTLSEIHKKLLDVDDNGDCKKKDILENITEKSQAILEKAMEFVAYPHGKIQKSCSKCPSLVKQKNLVDSKYSMYSLSAFKKEVKWKSPLEVACNKFKVQSRYKTAGFKHRPPMEKPKFSSAASKSGLFHRRSITCVKEISLVSPGNDDNIKTMISTENEKEKDKNYGSDVNLTHLESLTLLVQNLCDKIYAKEEKVVTQKQFESVLKGLSEIALTEGINNNRTSCAVKEQKDSFKHHKPTVKPLPCKSLSDLPQKETKNVVNGKQLAINLSKALENLTSAPNLLNKDLEEMKSTRSDKWETLSVIGEKNAQLICIRDNNPPLQPISKDSVCSLPEESKVEKNGETRMPKKVKVSRLPVSTLKRLSPLPKPRIKAILQNKVNHAKRIKGNPLYCGTYPWMLIEQISENLLDETLLTIVEEIQIHELLEGLYKAEFQ
ncbi:hypothetical protein FQA39_LY03682 [Lamprigera yunnana]|nr:hypothetical protein FQA39_LY03682 [Lamprigera yunnana]